MDRFDYAVIGGGIVGLSVAWAIIEKHGSVRIAVLEKENGWARHQTGRNSGVIHSGIYYKPGSLKAALCQQGNRRIVEFCDTYGIRYEVCGKVIVATEASELPRLDALYARGVAKVCSSESSQRPRFRKSSRMSRVWLEFACPPRGSWTFWRLQQTGRADSRKRRITAKKHTRHSHPNRLTECVLETSGDPLVARCVVNCAGLQSDRVAKLAGARPSARIIPFRGEYYELTPERRSLVRHLIYPVPDPDFPFLGVHFTRMIDGSVHAGPNAVLSLKREGYHRTSFDCRDFAEIVSYPGFWRLAARHTRSGLAEATALSASRPSCEACKGSFPKSGTNDLIPSELECALKLSSRTAAWWTTSLSSATKELSTSAMPPPRPPPPPWRSVDTSPSGFRKLEKLKC